MDLTVRKSKDGEWGFVESFSSYQSIEEGNLKFIISVSPEGKFSEPYVYREETFVPLKQIDEEMGIEKYIKAKKPFYSLLTAGFIVQMKVGLNFVTGEYLPHKSDFIIYKPIDCEGSSNPTKAKLHLVRVLDVPQETTNLLHRLAESVVSCKSDREKFLRLRINNQ